MKIIQILALLILTSCSYAVVTIKHPIPNKRSDLTEFNSNVIGEYLVTDTIIDDVFFDAANELYQPEIVIDTDTSVFITVQMKVVVSEHSLVSERAFTAYMFRSFYDSQDFGGSDDLKDIVFLGDTVKLVLKDQIDTLFNNQKFDLLRKFKGHYVLNKRRDLGYQPTFLTQVGREEWRLMDLTDDRMIDYYNSFDHENSEAKTDDLLYSEEPTTLKNSELRHLIKNEYLIVRHTLTKIVRE